MKSHRLVARDPYIYPNICIALPVPYVVMIVLTDAPRGIPESHAASIQHTHTYTLKSTGTQPDFHIIARLVVAHIPSCSCRAPPVNWSYTYMIIISSAEEDTNAHTFMHMMPKE